MNSYELLYILDSGLEEEAREALISKLNAIVTDNGGEIEGVDKWGTKKFAYEINFKNEGYYVLVNFKSAATVPAELDRVMGITDSVVRSMLIKKD